MTKQPADQTPTSPEMHWGIAYLRGDIQDLRGALARLDDRFARLEDKMDARFQSMMMWTIAGHGVVAGSIIAAIKL